MGFLCCVGYGKQQVNNLICVGIIVMSFGALISLTRAGHMSYVR